MSDEVNERIAKFVCKTLEKSMEPMLKNCDKICDHVVQMRTVVDTMKRRMDELETEVATLKVEKKARTETETSVKTPTGTSVDKKVNPTTLLERVMGHMPTAEQSPIGISVERLMQETGAPRADVMKVVDQLVSDMRVYATVDLNHYAAVQE